MMKSCGSAAAGQAAYAVCAACHGANGEGNPALNAPKLSGQHAWYLKRELQNFKNGARGTGDKEKFEKLDVLLPYLVVDRFTLFFDFVLCLGYRGDANECDDFVLQPSGVPVHERRGALPGRRSDLLGQDPDACLLAQLAHGGFDVGLAGFESASRELPPVPDLGQRWVVGPEQQHVAVGILDDDSHDIALDDGAISRQVVIHETIVPVRRARRDRPGW